MALNPSLAKLSELTAKVAKSAKNGPLIQKGKRGSGRYGRRPDFAVLSAPSSRPDSGAGVTFHFKHTFVSKKNSISSGYRDQTSAPAHQKYIERAGAAERTNDLTGRPREISFGNLGDNKEERADFWRKVEKIEGKAGRVQYRMIIELPHELSAFGRENAARQFMKILGDRGFPHWAVIHAPDKHNDSRNYHLHAVYYDRPCQRLPDGRWDFELETKIKWKNGQTQMKRPLKQNKDKDVKGDDWIKSLRSDWAEIANVSLKTEGLAKRYDPRPYRDSGVRKMPTSHLGNKISLAESQGIDTKAGSENSRREMLYRLSAPDDNFERASMAIDQAISAVRFASENPDTQGNVKQAMMAGLALRRILSNGVKAAKAREANSLAADILGGRLAKRAGFLDAEYDKLIVDPPKWLGQNTALSLAASLWDERRLIDDANSDLAPFIQSCRAASQTHEVEAARMDEGRQVTVNAMFHALPALRQMLTKHEIQDLTAPLGMPKQNLPVVTDLEDTRSKTKHTSIAPETVPAKTTADERITRKAPGAETTTEIKRAPAANSEQKASDAISTAKPFPEPARPTEVGVPGAAAQPAATPTATPEPVDKKTAAAKPKRQATTLDLPGALHIDEKTDLERMQKELAEAPGWQVRYHFLATRDASDFANDEKIAENHAKALVEIEREAANRGLDLETGRMDPANAKLKSAFDLHQEDWQPEEERQVQTRKRTQIL